MDRAKETELFDSLMRIRPLRDWLAQELATQVAVLLVNPDMTAINKAQGAAGFITRMQDKLSAAENAARR